MASFYPWLLTFLPTSQVLVNVSYFDWTCGGLGITDPFSQTGNTFCKPLTSAVQHPHLVFGSSSAGQGLRMHMLLTQE